MFWLLGIGADIHISITIHEYKSNSTCAQHCDNKKTGGYWIIKKLAIRVCKRFLNLSFGRPPNHPCTLAHVSYISWMPQNNKGLTCSQGKVSSLITNVSFFGLEAIFNHLGPESLITTARHLPLLLLFLLSSFPRPLLFSLSLFLFLFPLSCFDLFSTFFPFSTSCSVYRKKGIVPIRNIRFFYFLCVNSPIRFGILNSWSPFLFLFCEDISIRLFNIWPSSILPFFNYNS